MPIQISFDGIIGESPNTAAEVRAQLRAGGPVAVSINSFGGIATEGLAIHSLLKAHPGPVDVVVDALAASAASLIAMAGDTITMRAGSLLMIHDPAAVTIGTAAAHEKSRDVLDKMAGQFAKIYATRCGLSVSRVRALMLEETWMDSSEAVNLGFASAASDEGATASAPAFDYRMFKHAPATLLALAPPIPKRKTTMAKKPAAVPADDADDETIVADVTGDILTRCATAKLSAVQTADIVLKAKGNLDIARDLIIDAAAKAAGNQNFTPAAVGQGAGGDEDGQAKAIGDAMTAKLLGKSATGPYAGMSSVGLASEWLRARGIKLQSNDATSIVMQAMGGRRPYMSGGSGYHTTSDFPIILGDSMHKSLTNLFTAADSGVSLIAGVGTMQDFRTKSIGKLSSFPALLPVSEAGEITWGTLEEAGESISVATFARAISVSMQTLVNDNMGAIQRSIRDIAFAAVNLKAGLILTALLTARMSDGKTLFHADHNNVVHAGPPTVTALSAMRVAMRQQTALDGTTVLGLAPKVILVPSKHETAAQIIAATTQPTSASDVNPFSGGLVVAAEPRLDAIDADGWYGFADPSVMPAVEFDTLEGTPSPRLEIANPADFDRLGSAYRVWWACGAAGIEYRAAVRNSGEEVTD